MSVERLSGRESAWRSALPTRAATGRRRSGRLPKRIVHRLDSVGRTESGSFRTRDQSVHVESPFAETTCISIRLRNVYIIVSFCEKHGAAKQDQSVRSTRSESVVFASIGSMVLFDLPDAWCRKAFIIDHNEVLSRPREHRFAGGDSIPRGLRARRMRAPGPRKLSTSMFARCPRKLLQMIGLGPHRKATQRTSWSCTEPLVVWLNRPFRKRRH